MPHYLLTLLPIWGSYISGFTFFSKGSANELIHTIFCLALPRLREHDDCCAFLTASRADQRSRKLKAWINS